MYSKLIYLLSLALVLGTTANASACCDTGLNLIGFYEFEGNYLDSSGCGNHGVAMGNATIVDDPIKGLVLDVHAEDQQPTVFGYVDLGLGIGDPNFTSINDGITVMAWIWVRSFSMTNIPGDNEWEGIVTKGHDWRLHRDGSEDPDYDMRFTAEGLSVHTMYPEDGTAVWDGEWHHVAGVYDPNYYGDGSGRVMLYIDGMLDKTADCTGTITNLPSRAVWIGGQSDANTPGTHTRYFDGRIDDVRIYNRALLQPELIEPYPPCIKKAHYPNPWYRATVAGDDRESLELSWMPGACAAAHNVYFGTDPEALDQIGFEQTPNSITLTYPYDVLDLDEKYYWQVDEVNNAHPSSPWLGGIWEFTLSNWLTVDDFTTYSPITGGIGYPPDIVVWYSTGLPSMYLELTEQYETPQSMKIVYANNFAPYYSGAKRTFVSARDWSGVTDGVKALDLYVRGLTGNIDAPMYVELSDTTTNKKKVMLSPDLTSEDWQALHIDLQDFAPVVLSDVNSIEIGIGTGVPVAAAGTVYIDDIRLYTPRDKCELFPELWPVADFTGPQGVPDCFVDEFDLAAIIEHWLADAYSDTAGPLLCYKFEGDANDSSGYDEHGEPNFGASFVYDAGDANKPAGIVLSLDGINDCVELSYTPGIPRPYDPCDRYDGEHDSRAPLDPKKAITIAAWIKADSWTGNHTILEKGDMFKLTAESGGTVLQFDLTGWGPDGVAPALTTSLPSTGVWHHIAGTYDKAEMAWWLDGVKVAGSPASGVLNGLSSDPDNWFYNIGTKKIDSPAGDHFPGLISDVCIFDYPLSAEEIESLMKGWEIGFMAHYEMDDPNDSARGEQGSLYGGATLVYDAGDANKQVGMVLSLDGVDDCLDLSYTPGIPRPYDPCDQFDNEFDSWAPYDPCEEITICAWIDANSWKAPADNTRIIEKGDMFKFTKEDGVLRVDLNGWGPDGVEPGELDYAILPTVGRWHHLATTYDGEEQILYIDGNPVASVAGTGLINGLTADDGYWFYCIGSKKVGAVASDHFDGLIDDVRIYNYGMTADEIDTVMCGGEDGLMSQYSFDEGNANDSSGHNEHGEPNFGATFVYDAGDANKPAGIVLSLDGIDDCLELSYTPGIPKPYNPADTWAPYDPCEDMSICAWLKADTWAGGNRRIIEKGNQYKVSVVDGSTNLELDLQGQGPAGITPTVKVPVPSTGVWHHFAGTYDGTEIAIWLDGDKVAGSPASGVLNGLTDDLDYWFYNIGTKETDSPASEHFDGLIDDVRVYDYGLLQREIWKVMNGHAAGSRKYFPLLPSEKKVDLYVDERIDFKDFAVLGKDWLVPPLWPPP